MTEDQLFNLSDEELEARFNEAKATDEAVEEVEVVETEEVEDDESEEEVADEEEEVAELEQPDEDEDSDNDTSADDNEEETEEEDSEEAEEDDADPEEVDEEKPETEEDSKEKEAQPAQYSFKANGKEYTFSEDEMKAQFPKVFGQAMDYTKKTQAMKPWRKTIDAIEGAKLGHDDVNLMIDVLKGDKDAISEVLKRTGVDSLDLDAENSKYVAKDYGRDDTALAINDVIKEISSDKEYETTHKILSSEWDDKSWNELSANPEMIRLLHIDVKNGMFGKLQPVADKLKLYDRGMKSDIEYYEEASKQYYTDLGEQKATKERQDSVRVEREVGETKRREIDAVKQKRVKSDDVKKTAAKRKAATPVKKTTSVKKAVDYLDDSDESFEDWYQTVQDKM